MQTNSTVFVVDDNADMRDSLGMLVDAMGHAVRTFGSAAEFRAALPLDRRGCLVLDVKMPGESGLELYEALLRDGVRLPVIFMTAHADVRVAVAAMKTGAIEFLEKPFDRRTLQDRIEKALEIDRQWCDREREFDQIDLKISKLTERERETLELVIAGESNKSMATKLFISERAVEMRRASMMRKLGVKSTAELLRLAVTHRVLREVRHATQFEPFMSD
ncbi:MAG: response regulator transcription factor [Planctomycetales bacterium]|nr:response regulator transcription factor [Planctomycetales bacterium]